MKAISRAVVTGGAGFIGSHIVDELVGRGIETIVLDDLSTGSLENLRQHKGNKLLRVIIGGASKIASLLAEIGEIDIVFHEAAIANVSKSVSEPLFVHDVNVNATLQLLNFCVARGVKRLVFASSAAVYGQLAVPPAHEQLICLPSSPYGASKLAVENYLSAYYRTYGLEAVSLRYFNVYGPRQKVSDYSGVITIFISRLLEGRRPIVFGDGKQVRNFVNVRDIVSANVLAMESKNAVGESFNVASTTSASVLEILETLKVITGRSDITPEFAPARPGDPRLGIASIDKISSLLGYRPKTAFSQGLTELTDYMRSAPFGGAIRA